MPTQQRTKRTAAAPDAAPADHTRMMPSEAPEYNRLPSPDTHSASNVICEGTEKVRTTCDAGDHNVKRTQRAPQCGLA
jgi:hypothetical protein